MGLLAMLAMLRTAAGEVFVLSNGGRVEGELLNADEKPRTSYKIKLASGGQLSFEASQVKQVLAALHNVFVDNVFAAVLLVGKLVHQFQHDLFADGA